MTTGMNIRLAYGKTGLDVELPAGEYYVAVTTIAPGEVGNYQVTMNDGP